MFDDVKNPLFPLFIKHVIVCWAQMHIAVIPADKRQRNENCWSEASLGDNVRPLTTKENHMYVHVYEWEFNLNYNDPLILHTTRGGCFCYLGLAAFLCWLSFVCLFVCLVWVWANITQARVLGGGNLTETIPSIDWLVGKSMGIILIGNWCERTQPTLWDATITGRVVLDGIRRQDGQAMATSQ